MHSCKYTKQVERWSFIEITVQGPTEGNPFTDYTIQGTFACAHESKTVQGFYDGEGLYKVRFMPFFVEPYSFKVFGSFSKETFTGDFTVTEAQDGNHGPVRVANTFHFAYEDGRQYYPVGTTCYVWELQSKALQEQTLNTLKEGVFNKIRFCIFPKHYDYNLNEPRSYPYVGTPCDSSFLNSENFNEYNGRAEGNDWDLHRFNVEHFQHIEQTILKLQELGIEADLIVMHPYDRWGFSMMSVEEDDLYWKYVLARFSALRNVWWSLANEYDLLFTKTLQDWERYASLICRFDPYNHLRSIHNCRSFYDHTKPWITHCSIQRQDVYKSAEYVDAWRERFQKPIVLDEIGYEGNVQHGWGNLSGKELLRRFWEAACRGGYGGHGETYLAEDRILWWSHGGLLKGESPARIAFLRSILEDVPGIGLKSHPMNWDDVCATLDTMQTFFRKVQDYYLFYYGFNRPSFREYYFDDETPLQVEVIDTWDMVIENIGVFKGKFRIPLPGKEYMAVRIRTV
jgi:hypothetical protein